MTLILQDIGDRELVRFDVDPHRLCGRNDLPVARVTTPPGRLIKSEDGTHLLRLNGTDYSAKQILAGDCAEAKVELLLPLSARFLATAEWKRNWHFGPFVGPCPKCWKRNDVMKKEADEPIYCKHCGSQLVVYDCAQD